MMHARIGPWNLECEDNWMALSAREEPQAYSKVNVAPRSGEQNSEHGYQNTACVLHAARLVSYWKCVGLVHAGVG